VIRLNPDSKKITPDDTMNYDWFNALQDEVCTPIEKTQALSERLDQLATSIQKIIAGSGFDLGEVADYSGNPVPIPQLVIKPNEVKSFTLYLDIALKNPLLLENQENYAQDAGFNYALNFPLDTSSSQFKDLSVILSSNDILEKRSMSFSDHAIANDYVPIRLPENLKDLPRTEAISILKKINATTLCMRPSSLVPYVFGSKNNGISKLEEGTAYIDFSTAQSFFSKLCTELHIPPGAFQDGQEEIPLSFYYLFATFVPPVILASNPKGQIYYFFNKMMYGDFLNVRLGIFNLSQHTV
jgi:hypothetical protein